MQLMSDIETQPFDIESQDYLRRIHWWVRLFGIIWIVMPVVAAVFGVVFFVAALAMGS